MEMYGDQSGEFVFGYWVLLGEQGWRNGESTRLLPVWPGFKSRRRRHVWVEFVVGSFSCSQWFFSGYSGFPLSLKTNSSKFQFDLERILGAPCLNKLNLQKGKMRCSTMQTKYMRHVSVEVRK